MLSRVLIRKKDGAKTAGAYILARNIVVFPKLNNKKMEL
jgi:hypothetical protein